VKVSEAQALEVEVQRLREENAELRRKNNEISFLEVAKKRAEAKVESLEQKVRP
jgi:homeobox protein cut-like